MRVTTNTAMISRRRRLGTYATFAGLGILLAGMIASFRPGNTWSIWISLGSLVLGFALAQYGNYSLRRWGRTPRPDEVVETALKGFDDRFHYYAWSLPIPYVLLSPNGVYSFTLRDQTGQISVTGSEWHSKLSLMRIFLWFQEGLGNPTREALENAERLRQWILKEAPGFDVPVQPAIMFIDPRAQLTITDPTVPVLEPKGLKKWLRGSGRGASLKAADYRRLEALFNAKAAGEEYSDPAAPEGQTD
jgi:hypothetical protein